MLGGCVTPGPLQFHGISPIGPSPAGQFGETIHVGFTSPGVLPIEVQATYLHGDNAEAVCVAAAVAVKNITALGFDVSVIPLGFPVGLFGPVPIPANSGVMWTATSAVPIVGSAHVRDCPPPV